MSDFDRNKSDVSRMDSGEPVNEGELSENELNNVSGGLTRSRNADPNDVRNEAVRQRNDPNDRLTGDPA